MIASTVPPFLVPMLLMIHGGFSGHTLFMAHALPSSPAGSSSLSGGLSTMTWGSSARCGRPTAAAFASPLCRSSSSSWSILSREPFTRARLHRWRRARRMVVSMSSSGGAVGGGTQRRPQSDPNPVGFPPSAPAGGGVNGATASSAVPPAASPLVAPPPPPPVPAAGSSASSSSTGGGGVGNADEQDAVDPPLKHTPLGKWEYLHGNYVLRPSSMRKSGDEASYLSSGVPEARRPRALLHFLGGALVGAAPQLSYRYVLERLAENNYLVVATPFSLSFNHMGVCDEILDKFERVAPMLAREYGAIPVIGVGHSLGALLQVLISSLFPDTPRAGNIIMSYNNKDIREAVPLFDEVWTPFFVSLADDGEGILGPMMSLANGTTVSTNSTTGGAAAGVDDEIRRSRSSVEGLNLVLRVARTFTQGTLPSDKLLNDVRSYLTPPFLTSKSNPPLPVGIPDGIRDAIMSNIVTPQANLLTDRIAVLPLLDQCLDVADQIPRLIDEVAGGARDFDPPPSAVATAARRAYRARRTLLVQYEDDPLDETEVLEAYLRESEQIMRMKRPMVSNMEVRRVLLDGMGHATPCLAPPVEVAETAENVLGKEGASDALLYKKVDETVDEMVRWLEEAQL